MPPGTRTSITVTALRLSGLEGCQALLERHDNLWLDTTMMLSDYFRVPRKRSLLEARPERILYGTDFPSYPTPGTVRPGS